MKTLATNKAFGGTQYRIEHESSALKCNTTCSVFVPEMLREGQTFPVIYWLSGLTCTDENFTHKAGAQQYAADHQVILVAPDTSPRGVNVPDDPDGNYDLGLGAGFYINATEAPWNEHYQMFSYVSDKLINLVDKHFPTNGKQSITGHSMGGHGALTVGLNFPEKYQSISAFSPICHPSACPWGQKAFKAYLGQQETNWDKHDATKLIANSESVPPILIDIGSADQFLEEQLLHEDLLQAAKSANVDIEFNLRNGYDHSYYFIASFIESHIAFHANHLKS